MSQYCLLVTKCVLTKLLLHAALIESGLLKTCLSLFLQFPFNNLLHHLVTSIICFVLENVSTEVLDHLLGECQLVQWLVDAPEQVTLQQSGDSGKPPWPLVLISVRNLGSSLKQTTLPSSSLIEDTAMVRLSLSVCESLYRTAGRCRHVGPKHSTMTSSVRKTHATGNCSSQAGCAN